MKKLIFSLTFLISTANAQVMPSSLLYEFKPDAPPVINVEVNNSYENKIVRVETESFKISNPNTPEEQQNKEEALLVSPKSFSLGPSEKRVVRLLLKSKPKDKEDTYRVNFLPKSFSEETPSEQKTGINLTVLMGAGILVFAPPAGAKAELSWRKEKGVFILKNTGKKNLELGVEAACNSDQSSCKDPKVGKRLYEGQELQVKDGPILKISRELVSGAPQKMVIDKDEGNYTFPD